MAFSHSEFAWFIAMQQETPVGLTAEASFSPPPALDLISMWTDPESRGTGTAADLVSAVVEWARSDGASELLLWVADGNDRARRFYERLGFAATGNRKPLRSNPAVKEDELRLIL